MHPFWICMLSFMTLGTVYICARYGDLEGAYKYAKYFVVFWGGVVVAGVV